MIATFCCVGFVEESLGHSLIVSCLIFSHCPRATLVAAFCPTTAPPHHTGRHCGEEEERVAFRPFWKSLKNFPSSSSSVLLLPPEPRIAITFIPSLLHETDTQQEGGKSTANHASICLLAKSRWSWPLHEHTIGLCLHETRMGFHVKGTSPFHARRQSSGTSPERRKR